MIPELNVQVVDEAFAQWRPMELIDATRLAAMLSVSPRTLYRLREKGHLPDEIRIGGCVRWRLSDVEQWICAGCPKNGRGTKC